MGARLLCVLMDRYHVGAGADMCVLMNRYHVGAGADMSCGDDDDCIPSVGQRNNTKNKKTLESEHCLMFVDMNCLHIVQC